ncbi:CLUMA_CG001192, isoform A [Clunio marinus]|uniref:CLUMA_CG001192, isoform A n=1 Tax=Clunio marinus TaxID=568069 RepID=A0A1J1HLQ3_9DIPT|nr:CLUMA_CG001192, isoform A [Clunio marinus]
MNKTVTLKSLNKIKAVTSATQNPLRRSAGGRLISMTLKRSDTMNNGAKHKMKECLMTIVTNSCLLILKDVSKAFLCTYSATPINSFLFP